MSVVIRAENLGKAFRLGVLNRKVFFADWRRKLITHKPETEDEDLFWALRDVCFDVRDGDVVGLLGRNGSGKSTLLKVISQITAPTTGCVKVKGRVASLLEVGTGFHSELTGRDNVYLNGTILGMTRKEVARKFDEIVAFSGIEEFIDTPVKRYSVGMRVRLAFAVAANLEPEIMLIDEVLAVGDSAFQQKCLGKIGEVSRSGRTVMFVSHNAASIESLCTRGIVLDHGRLIFEGTQTEAIEKYGEARSAATGGLRERTDRSGSGEIRIVGIEVRNGRGEETAAARSGEEIEIWLDYERRVPGAFPQLAVQVLVTTHTGTPIFTQANWLEGQSFDGIPDAGRFVCRIPCLPLPPGHFQLGFKLQAHPHQGRHEHHAIDVMDVAAELLVEAGDYFGTGKLPVLQSGVCLVRGVWRHENTPLAKTTADTVA